MSAFANWLKGNWYLPIIMTALLSWGAWNTLATSTNAPRKLLNAEVDRLEDRVVKHEDYDNDRFSQMQQQILDQNKQMVEQLQKIWEKVK